MKSTAAFLVLSMVVLLAQPGECFFGHIIKSIGGYFLNIFKKTKLKRKIDFLNCYYLKKREEFLEHRFQNLVVSCSPAL
uniref:Uncharacterized protein n=1 Tax=Fundulus heteroclitus TaxID=8078 RepID=A0A3Q2QNJ2_FUNHE